MATTRAPGRLRTREMVVGRERKSWKGECLARDHCVCVIVKHDYDAPVVPKA